MTFTVSPSDAAHRLDQFLATHVPGISRAQAQRLIRDGHVRVDRGRPKAAMLVTAGTIIDVDIPPPAPAQPEPEAQPLAILYDAPDIVVIDKPAGMVVHPAAGHARGT